MKKKILHVLFLLLGASFLHGADITFENKSQQKIYPQEKIALTQLPEISSCNKSSFAWNLKAVPLTFVTVAYVVHGIGIGSVLLSQPYALLGATFFGSILLKPESAKDLFKNAHYYSKKAYSTAFK